MSRLPVMVSHLIVTTRIPTIVAEAGLVPRFISQMICSCSLVGIESYRELKSE